MTTTLDRAEQDTLEAIRAVQNRLFSTLTDWVAERNQIKAVQDAWNVHEEAVPYKGVGRTVLPNGRVLVIEEGDKGELQIEPLGIDPNGQLLVRLSAWPSLLRVYLRQKGKTNEWEIEADGGVPFRQPWNRATFTQLVADLLPPL